MGAKKDWSGNHKSVYTTLGSSHHTEDEREIYDFYATEPRALELLLKIEPSIITKPVWECACGEGHLSKVLEKAGAIVKSSDLIDRGYGETGIDFMGIDIQDWDGNIITNPPYIYAKEFILKALNIIPEGNMVAMFLKVQFMEGKGRKHLFVDFPPKTIWVSSSRLNCAKNGNFEGLRTSGGSAISYAWYVWEKGSKTPTVLKWFN